MIQREFDDAGALGDVKHSLARASRHPVHVDLGESYSEMGVEPLTQSTLDDPADPGGDVAERLARVEPQRDIHVVWNSRDDRRAYVGSERYNLIQHRAVIDAVQDALSATTGRVEKGVVRDYGEHVNGVLVFGNQEDAIIDVHDLVGDGYVPPEGSSGARDRLGLGMRFYNSFDGRSGYGGTAMAYRFICANWMVWGEESIDSRASYHIKSEHEAPGVDPDYFEAVIGSVFEQRDPLEGVVKDSIEEGEVPLSWAPGVLEQAGFGANYRKRITARLLSMEHPSDEHTTLWHIYNAATGHLDNDRAHDLGPERYDHHQGSAWSVLENDPEAPEEQHDDLEEYATGVAQA